MAHSPQVCLMRMKFAFVGPDGTSTVLFCLDIYGWEMHSFIWHNQSQLNMSDGYYFVYYIYI